LLGKHKVLRRKIPQTFLIPSGKFPYQIKTNYISIVCAISN